jgi:lipoteichoic acid synthase
VSSVAALAAAARRHLVRELGEAVGTWVFLPVLLAIVVKSFVAVCLINNPDHGVLVYEAVWGYDTSEAVFLSFPLALLALAFLLPGRWRLGYLLGVDALISLLLAADLCYYRAYNTFLSFVLLPEVGNLQGLEASVWSMVRPVDLLLFADFLLLLPAAWLLGRRGSRARPAPLVAVLLLGVAGGYIWRRHLMLDLTGDEDVRFLLPTWDVNQTISFQSPLGFHAVDLYDALLHTETVILSAEKREEIGRWFTASHEPWRESPLAGALARRNLIVLQLESFEELLIGRTVAGQEITPNLNRLAEQSLHFTSVHEQVLYGTTSDSELLVNTSVYPVRRGSTFFRFPGNTYPSLPRLLGEHGYATVAVHPERSVYWNWANAMHGIGFAHCVDATAFVADERIGLGLSDGSFLRQVVPLLERQPEPFFAFLVTLTSHGPFDIPERLRELRLTPELAGNVLGAYFQAQHYTDAQVGAFIAALERDGLLGRSALVVLGDHAGVHRFYPDELKVLAKPEPWWLDASRTVPFLIHARGLAAGRVDVVAGQVDVMPTLAFLMGLGEADVAQSAMGRNLLTTKESFAVLADGTFVGAASTPGRRRLAVDGLRVADLVITGDYFATGAAPGH